MLKGDTCVNSWSVQQGCPNVSLGATGALEAGPDRGSLIWVQWH